MGFQSECPHLSGIFRGVTHKDTQHDRLSVERRITDSTSIGPVRTSDIARLMELFQVRKLAVSDVRLL